MAENYPGWQTFEALLPEKDLSCAKKLSRCGKINTNWAHFDPSRRLSTPRWRSVTHPAG